VTICAFLLTTKPLPETENSLSRFGRFFRRFVVGFGRGFRRRRLGLGIGKIAGCGDAGIDFLDAIFDRGDNVAGCGQVELQGPFARGDDELMRFAKCIDGLRGQNSDYDFFTRGGARKVRLRLTIQSQNECNRLAIVKRPSRIGNAENPRAIPRKAAGGMLSQVV
jgi:hypothetical protein